MKNIIVILALITALSCKAQNPIISTVDYDNYDDIELIDGSYLKDVENKFTPFVGTWKWESGTSSLEIQFSKIEAVYNKNSLRYSDILIGKYRYVDNGVEKFNSLVLNITPNNFFSYAYALIWGGGYDTDTIKMFNVTDTLNNLECRLKFTLSSPTQATWKIWRYDGGKQPNGFTFPTEITLIKQ